ncbi:MAG TPA: TrpB-like pyridoxal-phosphate dependent enzyme, partial [Actinomycetota bacterium]|nr:TrpB-like pyridoxal-phosphate dependent enzyme [Actinomycetota bacterium]
GSTARLTPPLQRAALQEPLLPEQLAALLPEQLAEAPEQVAALPEQLAEAQRQPPARPRPRSLAAAPRLERS